MQEDITVHQGKPGMYVEYWDYYGGWVYFPKFATGIYVKKADGRPYGHSASSKKEAVKLATERAKEIGIDTLYVSYSPSRPLYKEIAVDSA